MKVSELRKILCECSDEDEILIETEDERFEDVNGARRIKVMDTSTITGGDYLEKDKIEFKNVLVIEAVI